VTILEASVGAPSQKEPGFVSRLDNQLENSWRERRWGSFLRAWVAAIIVTAAAGFIVSLIMIGTYELILSLIFHGGKGWKDVLGISSGIAAMAGGSAIIFTLPVIFTKSGQGKTRS
jgi:hypothetical protein